MVLDAFEELVHNCEKCKTLPFGQAIKYYPIVSFGDPKNKSILVVGLNPSTREYEEKYVNNSTSIEERHISQMNYFKKPPYRFFKHLMKYFDSPVKKKLGWVKTPWEKVGYLDIVKCPVRIHPHAQSQWGSLSPKDRSTLIDNCQGYLLLQLNSLQPKLVMAYGADVCRWFYPAYSTYDAFTIRRCTIARVDIEVLFVPQTRGSHPLETIEKVKSTIANYL